ncbi:hypothetical protein FE257_009435 [Aspergillus nanangensis]|uniref:Zn(2)-C6 fungal-type domain-containing protein n=1 Tax=Aspergillus nanangensis TaxID=2582783 RepID=A0AAD4CLF4_ASPNN|nr:hypothetical protein FE257_009435 [Aspergillus nanangensis]
MPKAQKAPSKQAQRIRAGKACRRCNQKRIKCDAMLQMPCTNCVQCGDVDCILRQSRRGTYIRKPNSRQPQPAGSFVDHENKEDDEEEDHGHRSCEPDPCQNRPEPESNEHSRLNGPDGALGFPESPTDHVSNATSPINQPGHILDQLSLPSQNQSTSTLCPQTQASRVSEGPTDHIESSPARQPSANSDTNASSYRDISWSTMFDHFLNSRKNTREFVDKCSITYFGESFPLAIVLEDMNEGGRPKLHHPGPPFPADIPDQLQPAHILTEDIQYLRIKGVFDLPDKELLDEFITVFLERVYPAADSIDSVAFDLFYRSNVLPAFRAAPGRVPVPSRRSVLLLQKVKLLFDSGYEIDKIVILQSAILMSFWGGGPNNYWNFYSWISTAVTLAEAIGMHRSTATTNMKSHDRSLLRRIWWVLIVRDSACSALVGRPFRIDMDQSDTEMLSLEDFTHDAPMPRNYTYAQYQIEIAKLSLILRDIVMSRFYPGRPLVHPVELHGRLSSWRGQLPASLSWSDEMADHSNSFSMTLSVQYNHHLILLYLGHMSKDSPSSSRQEYDHNMEITRSAAQHIAKVACTAVTKSSVLLVPHELFHGIFMAQAVFYTKLKSTNSLLAELGRSALTNCQMVLHESCECWDPSPWIMQLFDSLSTRLSEKQPVAGEHSSNPPCPAIGNPDQQAGLNLPISSNPEAGVFNGLLGYDPWQSNPMLSSLFDLPTEMFMAQ